MNGAVQLGIYGIHDISKGENPLLIHDHNLTVFSEGRVINYIHLERYTRNKYDASLSCHIEKICRELGLVGKHDIELCFVDHELGKTFISSEGNIRFEAINQSSGLTSDLQQGKGYWFGKTVRASWLSHEAAHLYSCIPFYGNFKENSLLIHYDGGASISNFSAWVYKSGKLQSIAYHYKLKWLTNLFNANALVFKLTGTPPKYHNSVPGKFMGLSAFGDYKKELEEWLDTNNYFSEIWSSAASFLVSVEKDWGIKLRSINNKHPLMQDIAATIHEIFVRESLSSILDLQKVTGCRFLYFTGGCALSIKLNAALLHSKAFKKIFIPPCTNDSGLSLGAAVALSMMKGHKIQLENPYLGSLPKKENSVKYTQRDVEKVAKLIFEYKVAGVCNGKSEAGPRALGNRSIIARADSRILAERISQKLKGRDWYRPLAPVMLRKYTSYFTAFNTLPEAAKFMLFDFTIIPGQRKELEGVVHVDGTARIQVLEKREYNPFMYDLLVACDEKYGIKALINTSFNRKGEPIVQTPDDAVQSARQMNLDILILNGKLTNF